MRLGKSDNWVGAGKLPLKALIIEPPRGILPPYHVYADSDDLCWFAQPVLNLSCVRKMNQLIRKCLTRKRVISNLIILGVMFAFGIYLTKYAWASWRTSLPLSPTVITIHPDTIKGALSEGGILSAAQVNQILDRQKQRIVILDIQKRELFTKSHIPSAVNIPSDELEVRAQDELPKSHLIVIVDCSCAGTNDESIIRRSGLVGLGFKNVAILDGGMDSWKHQGFKTDIGQ